MIRSLSVANSLRTFLFIGVSLLLGYNSLYAETPAVDSKALIQEIRNVYERQYGMMQTLSFEVLTREGKIKDSQFVEESTTSKILAYRFVGDSTIKTERFVSGSIAGEPATQKLLDDMVKKRQEAAKKREKSRKMGEISLSMYRPFLASHEQLYSIKYAGTATPKSSDRLCHQFDVQCNEESDSTVNGTFYFDAERLFMVRGEFSPTKIPKGAMFNMKEMSMELNFAPMSDTVWMPIEFRLQGRAKAMLFIGVNFAVQESYRNPKINDPATDTLFVGK